MKDKTTLELKEGYLIITVEGVRNDFDSLVVGTKKINEAAQAYNVNYILADYRKLRYDVPMADAFNLVKMFEQDLPLFDKIVISAIANPLDLELAKFWESICIKRGYQYKVFTDLEEGEEWIQSMVLESSKLSD